MLSELIKKKNLFYNLYLIDKSIADQYRQQPCPHCGGPLFFGNYHRKPRGEPEDLPENYFLQFSLCCGTEGCRRRLKPPSCRFLDGKIYWFPVILSVVSDWQDSSDAKSLSGRSNVIGISRQTLKRWLRYFQDTFPTSDLWKRLRGQVSACVSNSHLPSSLVNYFMSLKSCSTEAFVTCLTFLSGGYCSHHKIRAG